MSVEDVDGWLRSKFFDGYTYNEILVMMALELNVNMSIRHLHRQLKRLGLKRKQSWREEQLETALQAELVESGNSLGCRALQRRLLSRHGVSVSRDATLQLQHLMDPVGVEYRSRHCLTRRQYHNKGPNWLVHVDGYDKLKRYGFAIHGAICGYSRKVLWLKVARTNNDPSVIASYYLGYVQEIGGVPRCIRMDAGTENGHLADMQKAFRWEHTDDHSGDKSVVIGCSHSNQRIESWWRQLRQMGVNYWIDFFRQMELNGQYSTANEIEIECARFCFMPLIQSELDQIRLEWNGHRLRQSRDGQTTGKPDMLFYHPQLFDSQDFKFPIDVRDVDILIQFCQIPSSFGCSYDMFNRCMDVVNDHGLQQPQSSSEAANLLMQLKRHFTET